MANIIDRDLSLIEFHRRVFDEARDETNPLLERLKFLSILGTIVDEFAVSRHAALADTRESAAAMLALAAEARAYLRTVLTPALAATGIHLLRCADLQPDERAAVNTYFDESVLPLLMPLGYDAARPFPHISGRNIALAIVVRTGDTDQFACLEVPYRIPALVPF